MYIPKTFLSSVFRIIYVKPQSPYSQKVLVCIKLHTIELKTFKFNIQTQYFKVKNVRKFISAVLIYFPR